MNSSDSLTLEPANERPVLFSKFRPWKTTVQKEATPGAFEERNRTKEMLLSAQFYCQPPRFFDDPHDCLQGARATGSPLDIDRFIMHNLWEVPELMRKHGITSITKLKDIQDPEDQAKLKRLERKHRRRKMRVLSLSEAHGHELMFSFYGDNHQGICLRFDAAHPFFASAKKVCYVEDPKEIPDPMDDDPKNDPLLYTKSTSWGWQKEWRMVWEGEDPKLIAFPREALKIVVLGEWFRVAAGFDDLVRTLQAGHYNVQILQMERIPESFDYQVISIANVGAEHPNEETHETKQ